MSVLSKFQFPFQLLKFLGKNIKDKPLALCSITVILVLRPSVTGYGEKRREWKRYLLTQLISPWCALSHSCLFH